MIARIQNLSFGKLLPKEKEERKKGSVIVRKKCSPATKKGNASGVGPELAKEAASVMQEKTSVMQEKAVEEKDTAVNKQHTKPTQSTDPATQHKKSEKRNAPETDSLSPEKRRNSAMKKGLQLFSYADSDSCVCWKVLK